MSDENITIEELVEEMISFYTSEEFCKAYKYVSNALNNKLLIKEAMCKVESFENLNNRFPDNNELEIIIQETSECCLGFEVKYEQERQRVLELEREIKEYIEEEEE